MEQLAAERLRIARELHDGISQEIAVIGYRLDEIIGRNATNPETRETLRDIRSSLTGLNNSVRDEIHELRDLPRRTFNQVASELAGDLLDRVEISHIINYHGEPKTHFRFELIRALQEILVNAKSHSSAKKVTINISEYSLAVQDDGIGIHSVDNQRWGLVGLQERSVKMGAIFLVESNEFGTLVQISWHPNS